MVIQKERVENERQRGKDRLREGGGLNLACSQLCQDLNKQTNLEFLNLHANWQKIGQ